jgi:hypothetical protein
LARITRALSKPRDSIGPLPWAASSVVKVLQIA